MTHPPDSSGRADGDALPEEPQVPPGSNPPPQWGAPPPTPADPLPGYQPPPSYQPPPPPAPYPTPPPPAWGPPAFGLSAQEERTWGMFAHIGALIAGFVVGMSFLGPLIVLLAQGSKSAFVRRHAVESLNFQLTLLIASIVGAVLAVVLVVVTVGLALLVVVPLAVAVLIGAIVCTVIGGVKANSGEDYRYPVNIRMVK